MQAGRRVSNEAVAIAAAHIEAHLHALGFESTDVGRICAGCSLRSVLLRRL